ncbi:uncharacterized protein LOC130635515 [Hydractinia symbiolongicarpus]|uniref:uncharacterized protein LOC130635515 n=1 Tax=Hydractinia symbiolongicarpus TaxID=13093 RepID=UPI00254E8CAB|nr:uncharacterized protein LOC130635515 [Hydractinia symbiolongicarpus]XP_057300847.1 uncharacterized protein LOC130635515 [Hydractinia symbiolongicarpus]
MERHVACIKILFIWALCVNSAFPAVLYTDSPTISGIFNQSAIISFKATITANDNRTVKSFYVELPPSTQQIAIGSNNVLQALPVPPFNSRLTASAANQEYLLQVNPLKFSDDYTFRGVLIYLLNNDINNPIAVEQDVKLDVFGGPHVCGDDLPSNITLNATFSVVLSIHLCGRQKPLVTWSIDNETVTTHNSNTTENTTADAQYVYSVVLPKVSASMCGKTLKYIATGYESDKIGTALLDTQFKPPAVVITQSYKDLLCVRTTWDPIDIGLCTGYYEVNLMNSSDKTVHSAVLNDTTVDFTYCYNTSSGFINVTYVRVRALYGKQFGMWSQRNVSITAPTTVSTTTKSESSGAAGDDDDDDDKTLIIAIGAGAGGLVVLIIIFVLICCCCGCCGRKKEKDDLQRHSVRGYSYRETSNNNITADVYKNDVEMGNANTYTEFPAENKDELAENENNTRENEVAYKDMSVEFDNKEEGEEQEVKDEDDEHEFVSVAQLKYYDPEEFKIKKTPTIENLNTEKPTEEEHKANLGYVENRTYNDDEFDTDSDHDYENYDVTNNEKPEHENH